MKYYTHETDIDHEGDLDVEALTIRMERALEAAQRAVRAAHDRATGNLDPSAQSYLCALLGSFRSTHKSMRILYTAGEEDPELFADAISLLREQIEKVFMVALTLTDLNHYTDVALRDAFAKDYSNFLLHRLECYKLPRFEAFFRYGPGQFDVLARILGITPVQRGYYDYAFALLKNPNFTPDERRRTAKKGGPAPAPKKPYSNGVPGEFERLPQFPTPGGSKDRIKDPVVRDVLERWHHEYVFVCAYTHLGLAKFTPGVLLHGESAFSEEKQTRFRENEVDAHAITSLTAAASAVTEVMRAFKGDAPASLTREARALWDGLRDASLIARVFWKIQGEGVFEPAGSGAAAGS